MQKKPEQNNTAGNDIDQSDVVRENKKEKRSEIWQENGIIKKLNPRLSSELKINCETKKIFWRKYNFLEPLKSIPNFN